MRIVPAKKAKSHSSDPILGNGLRFQFAVTPTIQNVFHVMAVTLYGMTRKSRLAVLLLQTLNTGLKTKLRKLRYREEGR